VGLGIGEGAETVEFFLAGCVPEAELDELLVDIDVLYVVFKYGGFAVGRG
jgi:hypothetical protein